MRNINSLIHTQFVGGMSNSQSSFFHSLFLSLSLFPPLSFTHLNVAPYYETSIKVSITYDFFFAIFLKLNENANNNENKNKTKTNAIHICFGICHARTQIHRKNICTFSPFSQNLCDSNRKTSNEKFNLTHWSIAHHGNISFFWCHFISRFFFLQIVQPNLPMRCD